MNRTINDILQRRSIKKYNDRKVSEEDLDTILECGLYAPSGSNKQSAIMWAIEDKELIRKLEMMNAKVVGNDPERSHNFYGASVIIIVLADQKASTNVYDGSLVMANLMLAAKALGIGSCWINRSKQMFETQEGKALLEEHGIEGDYEGIGICLLGYYDEEPSAKPRRENRIFKN